MFAEITVGKPGELHSITVSGNPAAGYTVKLNGEFSSFHSGTAGLEGAKDQAKRWVAAFTADLISDAQFVYEARAEATK